MEKKTGAASILVINELIMSYMVEYWASAGTTTSCSTSTITSVVGFLTGLFFLPSFFTFFFTFLTTNTSGFFSEILVSSRLDSKVIPNCPDTPNSAGGSYCYGASLGATGAGIASKAFTGGEGCCCGYSLTLGVLFSLEATECCGEVCLGAMGGDNSFCTTGAAFTT